MRRAKVGTQPARAIRRVGHHHCSAARSDGEQAIEHGPGGRRLCACERIPAVRAKASAPEGAATEQRRLTGGGPESARSVRRLPAAVRFSRRPGSSVGKAHPARPLGGLTRPASRQRCSGRRVEYSGTACPLLAVAAGRASCSRARRCATLGCAHLPAAPALPSAAWNCSSPRTSTATSRPPVEGARSRPGLESIAAVVQAFRRRDGDRVLYLDAGDLLQGTRPPLHRREDTIDGLQRPRPAAVTLGNHDSTTTARTGPGRSSARGCREAQLPVPRLQRARPPHRPVRRRAGDPPLHAGDGGRAHRGRRWALRPSHADHHLPRQRGGPPVPPPQECVAREAAALRKQGAQAVVLLAHFGGRCPPGVADCAPDGELFQLAAGAPPGTVDAVAGGHTHQAFSLVAGGVPVVEPAVNGERLGWLSLCSNGSTVHAVLHPLIEPCIDQQRHALCTPNPDAPWLSEPGALPRTRRSPGGGADAAGGGARGPAAHRGDPERAVEAGAGCAVAGRPAGDLRARSSAPGSTWRY